jgi:hypothetical protein
MVSGLKTADPGLAPTGPFLLGSTHCKGLVEKVPFLDIANASEAISLGECQRDRHVASLLAMTLHDFFNTTISRSALSYTVFT